MGKHFAGATREAVPISMILFLGVQAAALMLHVEAAMEISFRNDFADQPVWMHTAKTKEFSRQGRLPGPSDTGC